MPDTITLPIGEIGTLPGLQRRERPYSEDTVNGILAEGFTPSKFDPIPVVWTPDGYAVGGDGHSRREALRRLADAGRLPADFTVSCRIVSPEDAEKLASTANNSRAAFTPIEEARIFALRLKGGDSLDRIAAENHRRPDYVKRRLDLVFLSAEIQALVGKPYGISVDHAVIFGHYCREYELDAGAQQRIWHDLLKDGDFTARTMTIALEAICPKAKESSDLGMLFELPTNLKAIIADLNGQMRQLERQAHILTAAIRLAERGQIGHAGLSFSLRSFGKAELRNLDSEILRRAETLGLSEAVQRLRSRTAKGPEPRTDTPADCAATAVSGLDVPYRTEGSYLLLLGKPRRVCRVVRRSGRCYMPANQLGDFVRRATRDYPGWTPAIVFVRPDGQTKVVDCADLAKG